ncbi:MAG: hypothetical protein O3C46_01380 [Bacteroidetes bacterium]|nr:hypothetical protein [Bacteroidota bacterium]
MAIVVCGFSKISDFPTLVLLNNIKLQGIMKTVLTFIFAGAFALAAQAQQANTTATPVDAKPAKACCSKGSASGCQSGAAKSATASAATPEKGKACCSKDHAGASCDSKGKSKAKARKEDN